MEGENVHSMAMNFYDFVDQFVSWKEKNGSEAKITLHFSANLDAKMRVAAPKYKKQE